MWPYALGCKRVGRHSWIPCAPWYQSPKQSDQHRCVPAARGALARNSHGRVRPIGPGVLTRDTVERWSSFRGRRKNKAPDTHLVWSARTCTARGQGAPGKSVEVGPNTAYVQKRRGGQPCSTNRKLVIGTSEVHARTAPVGGFYDAPVEQRLGSWRKGCLNVTCALQSGRCVILPPRSSSPRSSSLHCKRPGNACGNVDVRVVLTLQM